jgi:hypothetical protein
MDHWSAFVEDVPWVLSRGRTADVGRTKAPGAWSAESPHFEQLFPTLHKLLRAAHVTPIAIAPLDYQLFSWPRTTAAKGAGIPAWLCPEPSSEVPAGVHPDHAVLLRSFGGVVKRASEPETTWLLSHEDVLTEVEASRDASFISHYAWAFPEKKIPIEPSDYYSIAREANANTTLCHRRTGAVLLFAPDHAFTHVTPWQGCPEYTLYELEGAHNFRDWVNTVATQWIDAISGGK